MARLQLQRSLRTIYLSALMMLHFRMSLCVGKTIQCPIPPCNEDLPCTPEGSCSETVDPCITNPCPRNATCHVSIVSYTKECRCPTGYVGMFCEIPMERCSRNTCRHGGECYIGEAPTCFCTPGYKGTFCETPEDECLWNPCRNGAVCRLKGKRPACYCVPGFQGPLCDIEVDECVSQPCQHGGTCLNQIGKYKCVCPPEYTGRDCELEFNECSSSPCLNGATCLILGDSFTCSCSSGFSGGFCEFPVDVCSSSPCLNGGHCLDKDKGYICNCSMVGFVGLHCESPISPCSSQACQNNASCLEDSGTYKCLCQKGVHCEEDINECDSNPCQNGGLCENTQGSYICHCKPSSDVVPKYYGGKDCREQLNGCEGHACQNEYEPARFGYGNLTSYAVFHVGYNQSDYITISAFVRTRQPSALLMALGNGTSHDIAVSLEGGRLKVKTNNEHTIQSESIINDGLFHLISLEVTQRKVELYESSKMVDHIIMDTKVQTISVIHVGGLENSSETFRREGYFKGCIKDLRIGGEHIELFPRSEDDIENRVLINIILGCASDNLCELNPCQNGGFCYPAWDDYVCNCPPNTTGKACEELKWCQIAQCPPGSLCQPVNSGYECIATMVFSGTSHGLVYRSNGRVMRQLTNLSLGFRTRCSESILLHAERDPEVITVAIRDSRLVFHLRSGNSLHTVSLSSYNTVNDNQWHDVTLSMTEPGSGSSRWQMDIGEKPDKVISSVATGNLNFLKESTDIYLGVHRNGLIGNFTGCFGTVSIGGIHLPYFEDEDYQITRPQVEQFMKTSQGIVSTGCLPYNPCASHPCMHGGTCQDHFTHQICACPMGKTGKFCETVIPVDKCLSSPCLHGNCTDSADGYVCECQKGYTGTNCDINICRGHLCPNGATCVESPVGFACLCPANVTGQFCRYNKLPSTFCGNEKKNITCYNYGNCTDKYGQPGCTCLPGFEGERCEIDVDECESDPCLNGGLCQNLPNRYLCMCDLNFVGDRCEIDQSDTLSPGVFTAVASVVLALFFAACAGICIFIIVAGMRSNQGTYSPSRQEKEGSRVEMWNIAQPPPVERLI
uniref:Crumbs cell polarity complex component 1 n=1 Tax=Leptobrachium leishanense TaxID=445787 RepID=A0A8C5QRI6_9ANUR